LRMRCRVISAPFLWTWPKISTTLCTKSIAKREIFSRGEKKPPVGGVDGGRRSLSSENLSDESTYRVADSCTSGWCWPWRRNGSRFLRLALHFGCAGYAGLAYSGARNADGGADLAMPDRDAGAGFDSDTLKKEIHASLLQYLRASLIMRA